MSDVHVRAWVMDQLATGEFWGPYSPAVYVDGRPVDNGFTNNPSDAFLNQEEEEVVPAEPKPAYAVLDKGFYLIYFEEDATREHVIATIDAQPFPSTVFDEVVALEKRLNIVIENFNKEDRRFYV
jgi:hypothetical protein